MAAVDARDDLDDPGLVDDPVDHPVFAAACSEGWGERLAKGRANLSGRLSTVGGGSRQRNQSKCVAGVWLGLKRSASVAAGAAVVVEDAFKGGFGDDRDAVVARLVGFAGYGVGIGCDENPRCLGDPAVL